MVNLRVMAASFLNVLQKKRTTAKEVLDLKMPYPSHPYDLNTSVDTLEGTKAFKRDTANR